MRTRQALRLYTEVPFAEDGRRVARVLEQLPHRVGLARKRIGRAARYGGKRQPIADRVLPRHQRRARRCAGGFDQILRETQALTGEAVDIWRRCAAQFAPAVGSEIAVADVVGEDKNDVGFLLLLGGCLRRCRHQNEHCQN